jgi:hypothetical protein
MSDSHVVTPLDGDMSRVKYWRARAGLCGRDGVPLALLPAIFNLAASTCSLSLTAHCPSRCYQGGGWDPREMLQNVKSDYNEDTYSCVWGRPVYSVAK